MIVQPGTLLQSRGAEQYLAHRLGMVPDNKLNNILEVGYVPNHKMIVQPGTLLRSMGAWLYQAYHLG
jgi:hypothetical protein